MLLLVIFCVGIVCSVATEVVGRVGASRNRMSVNSYLEERGGRYYAIGRGTEQRVLREATPEEFASRMQYDRVARLLSAVGVISCFSAGAAFFGIGFAARGR
jgi:hypothetical protein